MAEFTVCTVLLACCLLAILHPCAISITVNRGYVFTIPKRLLAGESENGCLALHNLEPPAYIVLELLSPSTVAEEEILTSTSTVLKSETCLELNVPPTKYSNGRVRLKMKFDKHPDYVVNTEKEIYIEHDSLITFLETDKPVYKPGQDVNIRILMLKHDLKPWKKAIPKIWIENPSEVRVAQWTNTSTEHGMVQLKFSLSPEASPGTWEIKVEKKKSHSQIIHTTAFEVKKYVLPRFQVTITSPGYILADAENVTWNICAKYSYGKPVKGTLLLKSTPQTPSWKRKLNLPEIHYETEFDSSDGCAEFVLSGTVLGLTHWKFAPNNIVLIANFTEAGTGVVETSISRTVVVHQALKLEFVPNAPKYFKLGLPYHGKLRVLRQDDTPAPNEKIQLCLRVRGKDEWLRVVVQCRNFKSSTDGFIDFIIPPLHKNIVLLNIAATGIDYPTKYYSPDKRWRVFMDQPSVYSDVYPWYSPSDSYLSVVQGYQPIVCGEKYSFNVMYTIPANSNRTEPISFHYSINSKGDILIYGHVKHRPTRDTILNYSEFRNLLGAVETPGNRTEHNTVVHRFPLSVKITPSMAPVSSLLLYYIRSDGEIVATTYTIDVGHCFENKVKTAWHIDAQSPGTATQYHVEAAPWSFCGISAVDKSTLFLAGSKANLIDADQAFDRLEKFQPEPQNRPIWALNHCKPPTQSDTIAEVDHLPGPAMEALLGWDAQKRRRRHSMSFDNGVNYVDTLRAFDDFGTIVMSDLIIETRPCHISLDMDVPDRKITTSIMKAHIEIAFPLSNFPVAQAAMGPELGYVDQLPDQVTTLRSYFPETWLWEIVSTGKEGKITIERNLPHTITNWVGYTVCVSPTHGLGVAPSTTITAFQPFFLDYSLPYSVKRGEMLRMKVSLFNYMQHSLPVKIKLKDATGLDLHLSSPTSSFCVKPRDSVVHEYVLRPRVLGHVNITVSAAIDSDYADPCGPETLIYTRDVIVKPILVLPEGFPVDITKSAFICPKDFSDDSNIVWNLDLPEDLVPESARAYVTLVGDILGPAFENLENLVQLPMGCGEQNMILFVPNIHVIGYLDANGIENSELKARAIRNMEKGYQRELNYRHPDGSYSAFGPDRFESGSSMWLTAFVVKSFAQARNLIHIDERDLKLSVKWIVKRQLENGCFPVVGKVFHKDMKGGLQENDGSSSALTAYILISLLESGVPLTASLINNALYCLEKGTTFNNGNNPYTAALSTYALALLEHPTAVDNMKSLMDQATRHNDLLWWEDKSKPSLGLSIEMTAYAVLSLVKLGGEENMVEALKAVRWMSKKRNSEGGFTSTQDTVLGLEALTKYATVIATNTTDLSVLVTASGIDQIYRMHNDNRMVLTQIRLPILPTIVEIFAEGEGCILVQSNLKYNAMHTTGSEAFDLSVAATSVDFVNECSMQRIIACARYKLADEESNMALLEIGMISGYVPDRTSLHSLLEEPSTKVKRFEEDRDVVTIYFDKLTGEKTCISFIVSRENIVDRLEPANVKLYDYYQQELTVSSNYSFAQICSSADVTEEHPIPNPMPVESKETVGLSEDGEGNSENSKTLKKSLTTIEIESENKKNKPPRTFDSKPTTLPVTKTDLMENVHDTIEYKEQKGIEKDGDDANGGIEVYIENSDPTVYTDDSNIIKNAHAHNENNIVPDIARVSQGEFGSGQPDEIDVNPANNSDNNENLFVIIDHELETPDGIEGPIPVYVKPDPVNLERNVSFDDADKSRSMVPIDRHSTFSWSIPVYENNANGNLQINSSESSKIIQSCPTCNDKLPSDIDSIYCSASSVVKVAIRRLRKARMLLDLHASRDVKRLRSTIEFNLNPDCSCSPLDNPGSLALLIRSQGSDFVALENHSKRTLDNSTSIYGLPSAGGVPSKIAEMRTQCPIGG